MTIYTWLVILLVVSAIIFRGNQKNSNIFLIITFLSLFAVMGLRDVSAFGSDSYGSYPIIYRNIGNSDWKELFVEGEENYNIAFSYLTKLIFELTDGNYQAFITTISLFFVFSYVRFIKKYSPSPIQSVLCFLGLLYYTFLFDALKQSMAMTILLFAFDAIIEKKPVKFVILTVLATSFHFPAIVFLPAYWIGRMKLGQGYIILLAIMLMITYLLRNQLLNIMLRAYGSDEIEATMEGIRFLRNKVIIMIAIFVFAVLIRPPLPDDTIYNALLMFIGIAIILQTFSGYNNIFERLADYYFHTSIIFIPFIFEKGEVSRDFAVIRKKQLLSIMIWIICVFAIWRFLSTVNNSSIYMPYRFFWQ